jgi:hypothetical protein
MSLIFKNTHAYDRNQDVNPDETKYSGDRIATFMFYVSIVSELLLFNANSANLFSYIMARTS